MITDEFGQGLSLLTCGRLWLRPSPRNASSSTTGFNVIDEPLSACTRSWPGGT